MSETKNSGVHFTCFSPMCIKVMDFYLSNAGNYFTPTTTALSLEQSVNSTKACMNLLRNNFFLTKVSESGSTYYITSDNMKLWSESFKTHVNILIEKKDGVVIEEDI
ncbi:hypothetical protein K0U27_00610 [archaeon]|nr:hypothetical protein [archaeon]